MPETITHALTTKDRIKARLSLAASESGFDSLINSLIAGSTDYIESQIGRRLKETAYTDELYEGDGSGYLFLKNFPVAAISALKYRAGTVSNPSWTDYPADDYELENNGRAGLVRLYAITAAKISATYTAGYKIDFANVYDTTKHTLPFDISDLCERLVIRAFKRREKAGTLNESANGSSISWAAELEKEDTETLNRYSFQRL